MKRDMNLVRSILLVLEKYDHGHAPDKLTIEGFSEEQIGYHIYLMGQAGLLDVTVVTSCQSPSPTAIPIGMTWQGHDFLELAREPSRWRQAIDKVTKAGAAMTIDILKSVLVTLANQALQLP